MYSRDPNVNHDSLKPYLLRNSDSEQGICSDFIEEALSRIDEDDAILPIFTGAMVQISQELSKMNMNQDYKPYINVGFYLLTVHFSQVEKYTNALAVPGHLCQIPQAH